MERDLQEKREYLENQIPRENRVNLKRLTDRKKRRHRVSMKKYLLKDREPKRRKKKKAGRYNAMYRRAVKRKERRADALALGAEEGRDKLRKAAGRSKYPLIRRSPNEGTHMDKLHVSYDEYIVMRREPAELKHLSRRRKRKKHRLRK